MNEQVHSYINRHVRLTHAYTLCGRRVRHVVVHCDVTIRQPLRLWSCLWLLVACHVVYMYFHPVPLFAVYILKI